MLLVSVWLRNWKFAQLNRYLLKRQDTALDRCVELTVMASQFVIVPKLKSIKDFRLATLLRLWLQVAKKLEFMLVVYCVVPLAVSTYQ